MGKSRKAFKVQAPIGVGTSMRNFPIVCVGGSAGGLDAYIRLLQNLPADMGMAIVIVNHIRTMPTQLHTNLPRYTTMPVDLITESLLIVYLSFLKIGTCTSGMESSV